jgi:hypothetical protein
MNRLVIGAVLALAVIAGASACGGGTPGTSCKLEDVTGGLPGPGQTYAVVTIDNTTGSPIGTSLSIQLYDSDGQAYGNPVSMTEPKDSDGNPMSEIPAGQTVTTTTMADLDWSSAVSGYTCQVSG